MESVAEQPRPSRWRLVAFTTALIFAAALATSTTALFAADSDDQAVQPADQASATSQPTTAPANPNLPMVIYNDGAEKSAYIPSGWMGNTGSIALDDHCKDNPHGKKACLKAQYKAGDNFGGVVWQNPANNWGDQVGGFNLRGATKLTFWARGEDGDERVDFKFGILGSDKHYSDSANGETNVTLTKEWKKYEIDLSGKDMSRILTAFCWVVEGQGTPVTFYLDDVRYE